MTLVFYSDRAGGERYGGKVRTLIQEFHGILLFKNILKRFSSHMPSLFSKTKSVAKQAKSLFAVFNDLLVCFIR